jgi:N-hydroxyarylamine O-acetyltransferase
MDFDAYAKRIGYDGPQRADAEVLASLCLAHATTIPFENLDIHRGSRIDLAPERIFDKLVTRRRGGYCFEQNGLLLDMLRTIGFTARPLAARVAVGGPGAPRRPRTHMALLVEAGPRTYLADVGFGVHNMIAPLAFEPGVERGAYRIREIAWDGRALGPPPSFDVEAKEGDTWSPLYRVSLEEQEPADFVAANWFTSTYPESPFVKRKIVSIARRDGSRVLLLDQALETRHPDGTKETRVIPESEWDAFVRETFGL